jgi:hypothetical protein
LILGRKGSALKTTFPTKYENLRNLGTSVADPLHLGVDPDLDQQIYASSMEPDPEVDPDPAIFVIDLLCQKKKQFIKRFSAFCRYIYIIFQR